MNGANYTATLTLKAKDEASVVAERTMRKIEQSFRDAGKETTSFGERFAAFNTAAGTTLTAVGAAAAGAAALVYGFAKTVIAAADSIDQFTDSAAKLDIQVQTFAVLDHQARLAGTSVDSLGGIIRTLTRNVSEAIQGNEELADAFGKIGLSIDDLRGLSTEEAYFTVLDALAGMAPGLERNALGAKLLGRSFQELSPLLMQGSAGFKEASAEAERLGVTLDSQVAGKIQETGDQLDRLKTALTGVKITLVETFGPVVTAGLEKMTETVAGLNRDFRLMREHSAAIGEQFKKDILGAAVLEDEDAIRERVRRQFEVEQEERARLFEQSQGDTRFKQDWAANHERYRERMREFSQGQPTGDDLTSSEFDRVMAGLPIRFEQIKADWAAVTGFIQAKGAAAFAAVSSAAGAVADSPLAERAMAGIRRFNANRVAEAEETARRLQEIERRNAEEVRAIISEAEGYRVGKMMETEDGIRALYEEDMARARKHYEEKRLTEEEFQNYRLAKEEEVQERLAEIREEGLENQRSNYEAMTDGFKRFATDYGDTAQMIEDVSYRASEALASNLADAFTTLGDSTLDAEEKVKQFARSFVADLQRMIFQMLMFRAVSATMGGIFGGAAGAAAGGAVGTGGMAGQPSGSTGGFASAFSPAGGASLTPSLQSPANRPGGALPGEPGGAGGTTIVDARTFNVSAVDGDSVAKFFSRPEAREQMKANFVQTATSTAEGRTAIRTAGRR